MSKNLLPVFQEYSEEETEKNLSKVRAFTALSYPFFGNLILKAEMSLTRAIPTAGTDGKNFYINPDFWNGLTKQEKVFLLCHEVMHKGLCHHTRREKRNPDLWNQATDYAINLILVDSDLPLIKGGLLDEKYRNMAAEKIYAKLLQEQEQKQNQSPDQDQEQKQNQSPDQDQEQKQNQSLDQDQEQNKSSWNFGAVFDFPTEGENEQAELEQAEMEAKTSMQEALQVSKMIGKIPAGIDRVIEKLVDPIVNWQAELQEFFMEKVNSDYTFTVRNRRYSGAVMLPGLYSENIGEVIFAVDTSGSVSKKELNQFATEIITVANDLEPEKLHVVWCDTQVKDPQIFEAGDLQDVSQLKPIGGGGTSFKPVFDYAEEKGIEPCCLVYLTDGYAGTSQLKDPGYPVLWALTEKNKSFNPKFGKTIYCIIGDK